jgi:hypothetical protein
LTPLIVGKTCPPPSWHELFARYWWAFGWRAFLGNGPAGQEHGGKAEDDGAHQAPCTPEQETGLGSPSPTCPLEQRNMMAKRVALEWSCRIDAVLVKLEFSRYTSQHQKGSVFQWVTDQIAEGV